MGCGQGVFCQTPPEGFRETHDLFQHAPMISDVFFWETIIYGHQKKKTTFLGQEVVRCLIRSNASVEQNTEEGKIPLEMAVKPGSLFPKQLLYLLAPSFQAIFFFDGSFF